MSNMMLVEDKNHRVDLEQISRMQMEKCFLSIEIDNTECFLRWHQVVGFSCTERIRLDRKQQIGETEFISEKTLVTSAHLD